MNTAPANFFDFGAIAQDKVDTSTIDQLADRYCEEKARKNSRTGTRYRRELDFFFETLRRFGGDPEKPSRQQVDRYLAYLAMPHQAGHPGPCVRECTELPYAAASIAHRKDVLAGFYEYVSTIPSRPNHNPAKGLHVEVGEKKEVDVLTEWEVHDLWDAVRSRSWRDAVAVGLAGGLGMRREEISLARAENLGRIDAGPTLRFWRVKGRYWQTELLPTPVYEVIQEHLAGRTHGPILTRARSSRTTINPDTGQAEPPKLSLRGVDYLFEQIRAYSGVRPGDLYCHLMRHTSITLACTIKGLSKDRIKQFYGHVSERDHRRYNAYANRVFLHEIHNPIQGRGFWRLAA